MNSKIRTCLPLSQFLEYFPQINPYRLHQIGYFDPPTNTEFPTSHSRNHDGHCEDCIFQTGWQGGRISRDSILQAIQRAEEKFAQEMGFWPCPRFIVNDEAIYEGDCMTSRRSSYYGASSLADLVSASNGYSQTNAIKLKWGYFEQAGTMSLTPLGDFDAIRSDADNDEVAEMFTVGPVPVPDCTEPCEIAIYNTVSDRMGRPLQEWQIRPIEVSIDDTAGTGNWTATVTGHSWTLVQPRHITRTNPQCLASQSVDTYVTEVSVYRVTVNTAEQGYLRWRSGCTNPILAACSSTLWSQQSLISVLPIAECASSEEDDPCLPQPVDLSSCCRSTDQKNRCPDVAIINYRAGYPLANCKMDETIARAIAYLAASYMDCSLCGCSCGGSDDIFDRYRNIESFNLNSGNGGRKTFVRTKYVDNPFGVTYGATEAWRLVKDLRQTTYTIVK